MKKKLKQELATKTSAQLLKMQLEIQTQLTKSQLEKKANKLANTSSVKTLADDLARVKTIIRAKELAAKGATKATA